MYEINDKRGAIIAVQRLLGVNESGIYDKETLNATRKFQQSSGIEETGIVDYETFKLLIDQGVQSKQADTARGRLSEPRFPYQPGERDSNMSIINADLREAIKRYTHEDLLPRGVYYTSYTASAAKRLREIYMLSDGYKVDEVLYYKVIRDILT